MGTLKGSQIQTSQASRPDKTFANLSSGSHHGRTIESLYFVYSLRIITISATYK